MTVVLFALLLGALSCDGTLIAFGPDIREPEVCGWLDKVNGPQLVLS